MRPRLLLTINCKFAVDFLARGLQTRTAVARLPLRQLGFLVILSLVKLAESRLRTEEVVVQLFNSKCLPILYYGLEVCRFNKSQIDALQYVEISFFGEIFNTRWRDLIYECMLFLIVHWYLILLTKSLLCRSISVYVCALSCF